MIYVIATVDCKDNCKEAYLDVLSKNVSNVKAEKGCLRYEPTLDVDSGVAMQGGVRKNVVTIVEAWEDLDALHNHFKAPHMLAYREKAKDLVNQVTIQVLKPV